MFFNFIFRDELMQAIRGKGGVHGLRKVNSRKCH